MKTRKYKVGLGIIGGLVAFPMMAYAAGFLTNGLPQAGGTQFPTTLPLTGNETLPLDTNLPGGSSPQSESISINQMIAATEVTPTNFLTGGDFGINLWQRGTSSGAVTTTLTYTADRWWEIGSGTVTVNVSKQTGAGDIFNGTLASARFQRANGSAGVTQVCTGNTLTTGESVGLQGQKVEFSTYMQSGANFSPASGAVSLIIGYGTGTDQSAASFNLGTWTGQVNATQVVNITNAFTRYSVVTTIPTSATQVGVELCVTPVGTASTNDWFEFGLAQLAIDPGAVVATGSGASNVMPFFRRSPQEETAREQRTAFVLSDSAAATARLGLCQSISTTVGICNITLPVTMRAVPTVTVTTATSFGIIVPAGTQTACTTLAALASASTVNIGVLSCTSGATQVAGSAAGFVGAATGATNLVVFSSDL